jgi:hypothetical protein
MPIVTRGSRELYPGAVVEAWDIDAGDCPTKPTTESMLRELQKGEVSGKGASFVRGRIYSSATASEIDTNICNPP